VAMRFLAMDAQRVQGTPFNGLPFEDLVKGVENAVTVYANDPAQKWDNTLAVGQFSHVITSSKAPGVSVTLGASDLFASIIMRLADKHGGRAFINGLWPHLARMDDSTTPQQSVDNFILAASRAANKDLTRVFTERWKWPAPGEQARKELSRLKPVDPKDY
jgi:hypothetical protein